MRPTVYVCTLRKGKDLLQSFYTVACDRRQARQAFRRATPELSVRGGDGLKRKTDKL